jgi:hypothetical protein
MLQKALSSLTRRRFPGTGDSVSRWSVRLDRLPDGVDALLLLSVEELAVNGLRESFHHWVRTIAFPVRGSALGDPLPPRPALALRGARATPDDGHRKRARALLDDVEPDLQRFLREHARKLSEDLRIQLSLDGEEARKHEDERYRSRQGEVSSLIAENTLAKLEREVEKLKAERAQGQLFEEADRVERIDRSIEDKQEEIARRTRHYEEVREQLERERERVLKHLLPRRHAMSGEAQVFPISVEVRLPETRESGS